MKSKSIYYLTRPATGRLLNDWLNEHGMTNKDIKSVPLDEPGLIRKFLSGTSGVDAAVLWDPILENAVRNKQIRILKEGPYWQGMAMKKKLIAGHPEQAVKFMAAFKEAFWYWISNHEQVNQWYAEQEKISTEIIDQTSRINLNYREARSIKDIRLMPDQPDYLESLAKDAAYQYANGFTPQLVNPQKIINAEIAVQADMIVK